MTWRLTLSVCLLFSLGGCAGFDLFRMGGSAPPAELETARAALVAGYTDRAEATIVQIMPDLKGAPRRTAHLLLAEVRLQQERPEEALALAEDVLASRPNDGAANEIAGKAHLKLGNFDMAGGLFATALEGDEVSDEDRRRREDLRSLALGLAAYAQASPDVAREHWDEIDHPKLRSTVEQIVASQR